MGLVWAWTHGGLWLGSRHLALWSIRQTLICTSSNFSALKCKIGEKISGSQSVSSPPHQSSVTPQLSRLEWSKILFRAWNWNVGAAWCWHLSPASDEYFIMLCVPSMAEKTIQTSQTSYFTHQASSPHTRSSVSSKRFFTNNTTSSQVLKVSSFLLFIQDTEDSCLQQWEKLNAFVYSERNSYIWAVKKQF